MWDLKNYKLGFDPWGLGLFLLIMLPNLIWSAFPAPNDVLRSGSVTQTLDLAAQILQALMTAALCVVMNVTRDRPMKRGYAIGAAACAGLYFAGWAAYYAGTVNAVMILDLCLTPCGAFLIFALARKNAAALLPAGGFAICHLVFGVVNFIV